jgi:hypothetical protein
MADRYWVGGGSSANWNATSPTNWSATSGGSNDASVPTSADDVFLDGNSPNSTLSASITIRSLNCTGYTNTLTHNAGVQLTIAGKNAGINFSSAMTYTKGSDTTSNLYFSGQGLYSLETNGKILGNMRTDSTTASLVLRLVDDLTSSGEIDLGRGIIDKNNKKLTLANFSSSTTVFRGIHAGTTIASPSDTNNSSAISGGTASSGESNQQIAQSFTSGTTPILGVILRLFKSNDPTDDLIVSIKSSLTGSPLVSKSVSSADLVSARPNLFLFDTPLTVTPATTYYIVISRSGSRDTTNNWACYLDTSNPYAGGIRHTRSDDSWSNFSGSDLNFIVLEAGTPNDIEITGSGTFTWSVNSIRYYQYLGNTTIKLTDNSSTNKRFAGGNNSYPNIWVATQGSGILDLNGNNTIDVLKIDAGRTVEFGETQTQTIGTLEADGADLRSGESGTPFTFSKASGEITLTGGSLKDSTASGGATFNAVFVTNLGGNTGWNFLDLPDVVTNPPTNIDFQIATLNASIIDTSSLTVTRRGFVIALSPQSDPGNINPDSSSYSIVVDETGSFGVGTFSLFASGISSLTTYYVRAFAQTWVGFAYGNEVSFKTPSQYPGSIDITGQVTNSTLLQNAATNTAMTHAMSTTPTGMVNKITTTSGIINSTTNSTNLTNS